MKIPYYIKHLAIASAISIITLTPSAGAWFYAGREVRDWEKGHKYKWFDHKGMWWPFIPWFSLEVAWKYYLIAHILLPMINQ